jgi:hypothetical protein
MSTQYSVQFEADIVWLDRSAPVLHRYAREILMKCGQRANRPKTSYRAIAYATLRSDAKSVTPGRFLRRVWYISDHNVDGNPMQAVDPNTIATGRWSRRWRSTDPEDVFVPTY